MQSLFQMLMSSQLAEDHTPYVILVSSSCHTRALQMLCYQHHMHQAYVCVAGSIVVAEKYKTRGG